LATNPQHFGRVGQLNTAEAFAAALAVSGQEAAARKLLDAFHGSTAFFHVNESRFRRYRGAKTPHEMLAAERAEFSPVG
jgi:pre-rRNA-processing protein TSR3